MTSRSRFRPRGRSSASRPRSRRRSGRSSSSSSARRRTTSVDVYRYGWIGDYVDAINFLELWTCESGNNSTNYCNKEIDRLIDEARATADNDARYDLYAQIEEILLGEDGDVPIAPIYWYTSSYQERESIRETFKESLLGQVDLRNVEARE